MRIITERNTWLAVIAGVGISLAPVVIVAQVQEEKSPDGRFGMQCYEYAGEGIELCVVPFYRLLATPERYHGRMVALTGFIKKEFGVPTMFPSKESYLSGVNVEGIEIVDAKIPKEIQDELKNGVWPVYVIGVFDAKYQGGNISRLGALRNVRKIMKTRRVSG